MELSEAVEHAVQYLSEAKAKTLVGPSRDPPVHIFIDGACEPEATTIGGVLFDGSTVEAFGASIDEGTLRAWKSRLDQEQVIGQAELFPAVVARLTWSNRLEGRRVVFWIDNESARIALIKAYSPALPSLRLILQCVRFDALNNCDPWYARVPTVANVADSPSRMSAKFVRDIFGAIIVAPVLPIDAGVIECLK